MGWPITLTNSRDIDYDLNDKAYYTYEIEMHISYTGAKEYEEDLFITGNANVNDGWDGCNVIDTNPLLDENDGCLLQQISDPLRPYTEILRNIITEEISDNFYKEYTRLVGFGIWCHNK